MSLPTVGLSSNGLVTVRRVKRLGSGLSAISKEEMSCADCLKA